LDWNLSAFHPLNAASIVLPAGANTGVTVSMEPESKEALIIQAIQQAKSSIWAEMYTFTDARVAGALDQAAQAHLDVRVLYEPRLSQTALQNLSPDRQHFPVWAHPNQAALPNQQPVNTRHAKFMVIDGNIAGQAKAYVMTANFTAQALGGDQLSTTVNREYVVCDTNAQDIAALMAIFQADAQGQPLPDLGVSNVIVSTINAHSVLFKMLSSATHSIWAQTEEVGDPPTGGALAQSWSIEAALTTAAKSGVQVQLMLPPQNTGSAFIPDSSAALARLSGLPTLQIKTGSQYYMHAKLFIIDQRIAFVGSENLSRASLNYNREVGLLITSPGEVHKLCATFSSDWSGAPH
jgi:phosphatidylserine/phosphatidylglycerophosphate/cardiolipin synthase-like enzyme